MKKYLISGAAIAVLGASIALAQTTQTTTTYTQSPDETTKTTVTRSDDGYTQYKKTVTATHHYDAGVWNAPADYSARHFNLGDRLPGDLMESNYALSDYDAYNLAAPPTGTEWIRVGQDAFLVRADDGEIIQADYGVFL